MRLALIGVLALVCLPARAASQSQSDRAAEFSRLAREAWEFDLREDPLLATQVGDHRYNDRLPNESPAESQRRLEIKRGFRKRWEEIDRQQLPRGEQINYDIFGRLLADEIAEYEFHAHLTPITGRSGFHISFPELRRSVPLNTIRDYENYIARLTAFDQYTQGQIELMRAGIRQGQTLPDVVLEGYRESITPHMVTDATRSELYQPFTKFPDAMPQHQRERLAEAGRRAILSGVVPGYERFLKFMQEEYVPAARGSIGASALPRGREFYRHRVRKFTTLDLTPEEVHQLGLSEVKRIREEMQEVIKQVGFKGDFAAFVEHLRTSPRYYAESPEALMKETAYVLKKMDGQLPRLFGRLPRTPYGIREIPEYIAPRTTTAYYEPPPGDGSRAGYYYVNTYDLKSRPLFEIEALSLHEAVPGHHLQIALAQEQGDLPDFRRFAGFTAFVEGWGLYAERLGLEVGFYEDPYSNFGRLSYEMWRACRLVVDTGIHYLGWTRSQAIDFMAGNSALSLLNIRSEVDRYIAWPGQALAYKIGELKIRELRRMAQERLGQRFEVREFHDVVLGSGALPLTVLEENVKAYLQAKSG
jgi:uncharacterized protein (DUF885 family)